MIETTEQQEKRPNGRPPIGPPLTLAIDPDLWQQLERMVRSGDHKTPPAAARYLMRVGMTVVQERERHTPEQEAGE